MDNSSLKEQVERCRTLAIGAVEFTKKRLAADRQKVIELAKRLSADGP